ncbi:hypothetical protein SLS60_006561 [Paraconiothyrium brasiliense]|uniref:Uncharacterized protein n=1 Tax=Paraconiothyrium brasiliense TaxID=300254 RepID=A0ABR3RB30_9PLEO
MQSPMSPTFGFHEPFDVSKPHRLIDQRNTRGMLYKKVIVLAKQGCDLTEPIIFLKDKGYRVYDDAEALHNGDLPIWREALEAKKAGKSYDKDDWNKFLGGYDALVTRLVVPFTEEFTHKANNPLAKFVLITKPPSATTVGLIQSFFTDKVFPLLDPMVFGLFLNLKLISDDGLNYDAIRANLGPQQDLVAMDDFTIEVANAFIQGCIPQGPTAAVESIIAARLRGIKDFIGQNYIHPMNKYLTAISFISAFILFSNILGPTTTVVLFVGCAFVAFFVIPAAAPAEEAEIKHRPECIPPHRRRKIAADAAAAAAAAYAAETKVRPAFIPPHLRKKITATAAATAAATDAPAVETKVRPALIPPHMRKKITATAPDARAIDAPATETKITKSALTASIQLKATATTFVPPRQQKKGTAGQKKSIRTYRSGAHGTVRAKSVQRPVHTARPERPVLNGWGNMETIMRQDDLKTRLQNEAKAAAMKDMAPGVWAETYAARSSKPIAEKKAGDN